jgi:hypothetical protein
MRPRVKGIEASLGDDVLVCVTIHRWKASNVHKITTYVTRIFTSEQARSVRGNKNFDGDICRRKNIGRVGNKEERCLRGLSCKKGPSCSLPAESSRLRTSVNSQGKSAYVESSRKPEASIRHARRH